MRSIIKIHGGKYYLKKFIINHFPSNYSSLTYVEPYCGAANILLNKLPSVKEIINDIDSSIISIFQCLSQLPFRLMTKLKEIPYTEDVFESAKNKDCFQNEIDYVIRELIVRRMSRGGLKKAFAWSERQRGGKPGDENAWNTIINQIPIISERLRNVLIFNEPALDIIEKFNDEKTLLYCDPPYLQSTRQSKQVYNFEMTEQDHINLAQKLNIFKGKVLISGYASPLYEKLYKGWNFDSIDVANHSSQQKIKKRKTECVYFNYNI